MNNVHYLLDTNIFIYHTIINTNHEGHEGTLKRAKGKGVIGERLGCRASILPFWRIYSMII
jgi:hypothetical protein